MEGVKMNRQEYLKNWNRKNPDYMKQWRIKNKENIVLKAKKWRIENQEKLKVYHKEYNLIHEKDRQEWQLKHKKERLARSNLWNKLHKENIKQNKKNYRKRKQNDYNFKILHNLRSRIYHALKSDQKSGKSIDLLGCTIQELKIHLEKQFTEGMNWQNNTLKGWHIDHIKPCASFDLSKPENQKECFHYTNLRPLWAKDNLTREKFKRIKQNDKAIFL
jgi:hypothetical protein